MIETAIPEIDVTSLMEKVRDEAQKLKHVSPVPPPATPLAVQLPPIASATSPTSYPSGARPKFDTAKVLDQIRRAGEANDGPRWLPKFLRKGFRRQRAYNQRLFEAANALARATADLCVCVAAQDEALRALSVARAGDVAWMRAASRILPSLATDTHHLKQEIEGATGLSQQFSRLDARVTSDSSFIKGELGYYRAAIVRLTEPQARESKPHDPPIAPEIPDGMLDAFYVSFEDRFRGTREAIAEKLNHYLPIVERAKAGTKSRPLLDIGCGRGEWLELLAAHGFEGRGIDLNAAMQSHCAARRLNVIRADALAYLRSLPTESLGSVSGFHIIEHLSFDTLMMMLGEVYRVLAPGGVAIFESPNCKNLVVGASTFYLDPTHRNPVYPETAELMLSMAGFAPIELHYLSRSEGSPFNRRDGASAYLDERLFGPQDFGVIGYKPSAE